MARFNLGHVNPIDETIVLEVGGQRFKTCLDTLRRLPKTRLGRMAMDIPDDEIPKELFFDRSSKLMDGILGLYRTGELHIPPTLCSRVVEDELKFWGVPMELISDCCWKHFESQRCERSVVTYLHRFLQGAYADLVIKYPMSLRMKIWCLLERPAPTLVSRVWRIIFFTFVLASILSFVLETDRNFRQPREIFRKSIMEPQNMTLGDAYNELTPVHFMSVTEPVLWLVEMRHITYGFFVVDFFVRFTTCKSKWEFFRQSRNWLEIAVTVKSTLHLLMEKLVLNKELENIGEVEKHMALLLYALSGMRVLRILYLANTFVGLKVVLLSLWSSVNDTLLMIICTFVSVSLFGTAIYLVSILHGYKVFPNILETMWFAIITMTTVGYGDVTPDGVTGKILGAFCAVGGVVLLALPIAVISKNFTLYYHCYNAYKQKVIQKSFLIAHPRYSVFCPPKATSPCFQSSPDESSSGGNGAERQQQVHASRLRSCCAKLGRSRVSQN